VAGQRTGVRVRERLQEALLLFRIDELDPRIVLVALELGDEPQARVDRVDDDPVLLGDLRAQALDRCVAHGRPAMCNRSLFRLRGIVISLNGYVRRGTTGSPSDGARSRTVTAMRLPASRP